MGKYSIRIKPTAVKEIEAIPSKADRQKIIERIQALADDPRPPGCKKLTGREQYRVRQGWYRIVYAVNDQEITVFVVKVGHRKDVYK
ncbi:MAG: type II toxin-antitoxin system RelE/ParE family toxin [Ardenticatenaceae bacterium]|nr:type II toxin-antitoxin system RelE/ParE family toxin [Anaerolineales bacterium]MCB8923239.1 type II toxin-antitoxin system RelE/ParE family toxin [Ardenticatenaceae bacterium]MCB8992256.1 type II toxin-antitoxin system RelE/ParE family toxin [Ardenticatenaceae bacterium]MCB9004816.1 type II toxin-antitoxin system RelE/ParE family toxin [Ardenticatenaceae bacterium]